MGIAGEGMCGPRTGFLILNSFTRGPMSNNNHQEGERVKTISDMLEQKVSYVEVGKRLGISKARVGQIALAHVP